MNLYRRPQLRFSLVCKSALNIWIIDWQVFEQSRGASLGTWYLSVWSCFQQKGKQCDLAWFLRLLFLTPPLFFTQWFSYSIEKFFQCRPGTTWRPMWYPVANQNTRFGRGVLRSVQHGLCHIDCVGPFGVAWRVSIGCRVPCWRDKWYPLGTWNFSLLVFNLIYDCNCSTPVIFLYHK